MREGSEKIGEETTIELSQRTAIIGLVVLVLASSLFSAAFSTHWAQGSEIRQELDGEQGPQCARAQGEPELGVEPEFLVATA